MRDGMCHRKKPDGSEHLRKLVLERDMGSYETLAVFDHIAKLDFKPMAIVKG